MLSPTEVDQLSGCLTVPFCRQHKTIILRPLHFQERSVSFLVRYSADDCFEKSVPATTQPTPAGTVLQCERVPTHLMSDHWLSLLDNRGHQIQTQPLVLADSSTHLQILSKFEDAAYIHVYASSHGSDCSQRSGPGSSAVGQDVPGTTCSGNSSSMSSKIAAVPELLFELPRFGLEFELREGRLLSKDHRGYCLSMCQQLVTKKSPGAATSDSIPSALPGAGDEANSSTDSSSRVGIESNTTVHYTLPGFQQYLILEPVHQDSTDLPRLADGNGTKLVLMPAGRVVQTRPKGSSSSSSKASATAIASVAIPTHAGASVLVSSSMLLLKNLSRQQMHVQCLSPRILLLLLIQLALPLLAVNSGVHIVLYRSAHGSWALE